jgi:hypothetical protein
MIVTTRLCDKTIQFKGKYPELQTFFKDYLVEDTNPELRFSWTDEEILAEQELVPNENFPLSYLETLTALRKVSEIFPQHNRLLIHGASISYKDKAYLFCAPSGTGKSTHIQLLKEYLGKDVGIVNGDKPFVSLDNDVPIIYGTPWAGKENWHRNCAFPLHGICFIKRGIQNKIRKLESFECLTLLMKQVYIPKDSISAGKTLELIDKLIKQVPFYLLECDISEDAVKCSFEAMT